MPSFQRKLRALVVIEGRRNPALHHMAVGTARVPILGGELAGMGVGMARFAGLRRSLELDFMGTGGGLVAIAARHRAVRAEQREFRFRMVEISYVDP